MKCIIITQLVHEIATKFQVQHLCFGVQLSNGTSGNIFRSNRKCITKMAAPKLGIHITQLIRKIATKFKVLHLCFLGPAFQWN